MLREADEDSVFFAIKPLFFGEDDPFIDIKLGQEAQITLRISKNEYNNITGEIEKKLPENLRNEVPKSKYLREALLMSHILLPKNWSLLIDVIDKGAKRNPLRGEKLIALAFDTNIFRRRYSYFICKYLQNLRGTPVGVIIPNGVRDEIFSKMRWQRKYDSDKCQELSKAWGEKAFSEVCFNQPFLEDRIWRNASVECRATEKSTFTKEIVCLKGDENIIQALSEEKGLDVVLVTEDDGMVNLARLNKIQAIRLDPPAINAIWNLSGHYKWDSLNELLYSLSIIYGAIKIVYDSKIVAYVYGIWAGKKEENWDSRELKINIKDNKLKRNLDRLNIPLI